MKTIRTCDDLFGAELLKGRLISEGIPAEVIHGAIEQVLPYSFGMPSLRPQVVVADEDFDRAAALLQEDAPPATLACPYCGSEDIRFGLQGGSLWRRIVLWIMLPVYLISGGPLGKINSSYYCKTCQGRFS